MQDVGVTRTRLAFAAVTIVSAAVACGPKHSSSGGGGSGAMPAAVSAYAGLRWVPADASYAFASRKTSDVVAVARELVDALGILGEFDLAEARAEASQELGFDPFSDDDLAELGIDLERGAAIWSTGVGPSLALPLADPERFAAWIAKVRGSAAVQVIRAHDVDVYTYRGDSDEAFHWVIAGDWMLAHLEPTAERETEGAWFEAAWNARGGLAGHADFAAALDEATRRLGADPPVVGLVRARHLFAHPLISAELATNPGCQPLYRDIDRVFLSAVAHEGDARGAIVVEIGPAIDHVRKHTLPVTAGWAAARAKAPFQLELGFDLHVLSQALEACSGESLVRGDAELEHVRGLRSYFHELDMDRYDGRGGFVVEAVDAAFMKRTISEALDEIPGIRFMTKTRTVAGLTVAEINIPSFPSITYGMTGTTGFATVGAPIDAMLGSGIVAAGGDLFHVELWPRAWPAETWDSALRPMIERQELRAALIRRLRAWSLGQITLTAEGRALVLTAHGAR